MLELLPREDLVAWRLVAADLIVGLAVAGASYLVAGRLAARGLRSPLVRRRPVRAAAAVVYAAAIVLAGRHTYGPLVRLALTAPGDRPVQRFADRVARSPEVRAWYARRTAALRGQGEGDDMVSRLAYERAELPRDGFARLDDARLKQRTDLLARAFTHANGRWTCTSILTGDEDEVPRVLSRVDRAAAEAWYQLIFDAMMAEIRGAPSPWRVTGDQRAAVLAALAPKSGTSLPADFLYPPTESGSQILRQRCDRERWLYTTVAAWTGPRRALADRLLATADALLTGDLADEDGGARTEP